MKRVAILGAGSWGTALATLLGSRDSATLWSRDEDLVLSMEARQENTRYLAGIPLSANVHYTSNLESALEGAECVVFAVPSGGIRDVALLAAPHISSAHLIVSASKGLEETTGLRMSEIIRESLSSGGAPIAALSGPNLALEVARGVPTASVSASDNLEAAAACRDLWMCPTFRVYTSRDLVGVELAGAMKNVIAITAGITEGLGFGDNSRAALMTRGLAEITRLGAALGAQTSTFLGLAGVGDLIATGGSRLSRNYRVGIGLGQGKKLDEILDKLGQVAEGVPTTRAIVLLASRTGVEMPISVALHRVLFEGASVRESITSLMVRPPKHEADA